MMNRALFALSCVGLCISVAQAEVVYNVPYTSLGAGGSYATNVNQNGKEDSGLFNGAGANLFMGAPVNRYFAPEVGVDYFSVGSVGKVGIVAINGRVTIPLKPNVLLFGKVGGGWTEVTTCYLDCQTTDNVVPTLGAGIGYGFSPNWMGTLEFNGAYYPGSGNAQGLIGLMTLGVTGFWRS